MNKIKGLNVTVHTVWSILEQALFLYNSIIFLIGMGSNNLYQSYVTELF